MEREIPAAGSSLQSANSDSFKRGGFLKIILNHHRVKLTFCVVLCVKIHRAVHQICQLYCKKIKFNTSKIN